MTMVRFARREPRLALAMIISIVGASLVLSVALLEAAGVVRVFAVVQPHANGAVGAHHMYGIESASRALTTAHERGLLLAAVGFTVWILRLARRTAGYLIGGLRGIGLFLPPITIPILAGALHAAVEGIIQEDHRARWHRVVTGWRATAIVAVVLDWAMTPGWSSLGGVWTLERAMSIVVGGLVAVSVVLGVGVAASLTWRWQHLTPDEERTLERRLGQLPVS
jgi:hypothetical protein